MTGPTQRQRLRDKRDPEARSFIQVSGLIIACTIFICSCIVLSGECTVQDLPELFFDVATLKRQPITAQDNVAAAVALCICLPILQIVDLLVCQPLMGHSAGARWFLLHALGNTAVSVFAFPDFIHLFNDAPNALSVDYCRRCPGFLGVDACSDWPSSLIIAMHLYHVLGFQLNAADTFHHVVFVPIIGGMHFAVPWGASGNILAFFISGFPGPTIFSFAQQYFMPN